MKLMHSDRLPEITPEQEKKRCEELSHIKVSFSDRLVMIGTAFLWIFLPCAAILLGIAFLTLWLFGIL